MVKQTRREFLKSLPLFGALIGAFGVFARNFLLYLFPAVKEKKYHKYLVCKVDELDIGKAKKIDIGGKPVYVVRLEDGYRVFSGICTHLGCIIRWEDRNKRFLCPCHKGVFAPDGSVVSGPPPRPLDRYRVETEKNLVFMYIEQKIRSPWV